MDMWLNRVIHHGDKPAHIFHSTLTDVGIFQVHQMHGVMESAKSRNNTSSFQGLSTSGA